MVEIGSGHAELTRHIFQHPVTVIAVERDSRLAALLARNFQFSIFNFQTMTNFQFSDPPRLLIEGDALKVLPRLAEMLQEAGVSYKLVGNIPYYITGRLLRVIGELQHMPTCVVLTVQKEVAVRMCAVPPKMNLLAASVQFWALPEMLFSIPKRDFRPPPKIDSAVIRLTPHAEARLDIRDAYYSLAKALFQQPRKTIFNNLRKSDFGNAGEEALRQTLDAVGVNPNDRPQNVDVSHIISLVSTHV